MLPERSVWTWRLALATGRNEIGLEVFELGSNRDGDRRAAIMLATLSPSHGSSPRNIAGNGLGHFLEEMAGVIGMP
jgi:hypothetical protein